MTNETLDYMRDWSARIADQRAEYINCIRASLKAGEMSTYDAALCLGYVNATDAERNATLAQ
jgi:hypothetical protein